MSRTDGSADNAGTTGSSSTEQRLMEAAGALFASKGYTAVGIREIAREAGLTIGSLYHYAASKEDLFLTLMRRNYARTTARARQAAMTGTTPAERLINLVKAHVLAEVRDEFEQIWRDVIEDGIADGSFKPEDPALTRFSIIQMCNGVALWYRPDGRLTLDEISGIISRQALALLGRP